MTWSIIPTYFGKERIQCILQDPVSATHLYVGTFKGLYHGSPATSDWLKLNIGYSIPDVSDIQVDPFKPDTLVATSYLVGGVYVTDNRGKKWERIDTYTSPIRGYSFTFDKHQEGKLYIGTYGHSIAVTSNYRDGLKAPQTN
jgi:hypothetical protein